MNNNPADARMIAAAREAARIFGNRATAAVCALGGTVDDIVVELYDDVSTGGHPVSVPIAVGTVTYRGKLPLRLSDKGLVTEHGMVPFDYPIEPGVSTLDAPGGRVVDFFAQLRASTPATLSTADMHKNAAVEITAHRVYGGDHVLDLLDLSNQLDNVLGIYVRPTDLRVFDRDGMGRRFGIIDASKPDIDDEAGTLIALLDTFRKVEAAKR